MIKVGVIGVGHLGQHHARAYMQLPDANLIGVCDINRKRADEIAVKYRTKSFYDFKEMLPFVDAVSVVVPTKIHFSVALEALNAGKDVLVEKPIATNLKEADCLIEIANRKNLILQVGHIERFNSAVMKLEGIIQNPRFIEALRLATFHPRGKDISVVLELMIHDLDIALHFLRENVKKIEAIGTPVISNSVDIANARLEFESGCVVNLTASRISREKIRKIRFFQKDAYVSLDYIKQEAQVFCKKKMIEGIPENLEDFVDFKTIVGDMKEPLVLELSSFLDSVMNRTPPKVSGEEGRTALSVGLSILGEIERRQM